MCICYDIKMSESPNIQELESKIATAETNLKQAKIGEKFTSSKYATEVGINTESNRLAANLETHNAQNKLDKLKQQLAELKKTTLDQPQLRSKDSC